MVKPETQIWTLDPMALAKSGEISVLLGKGLCLGNQNRAGQIPRLVWNQTDPSFPFKPQILLRYPDA